MTTKNKNKVNQALNFVEELSWLLKSNKNLNLEETVTLLRSLDEEELNNNFRNESKSNLVGVLPFLFQDKELFPKNKDLIEFAENLFHIPITRRDKRTRYELIGLIVTSIIDIEDENLDTVLNALSLITNDKNKLLQIRKEKKEINFSWNDIISNLNR